MSEFTYRSWHLKILGGGGGALKKHPVFWHVLPVVPDPLNLFFILTPYRPLCTGCCCCQGVLKALTIESLDACTVKVKNLVRGSDSEALRTHAVEDSPAGRIFKELSSAAGRLQKNSCVFTITHSSKRQRHSASELREILWMFCLRLRAMIRRPF